MFETETYENILKRMLQRVPAKMDKREGSVIWDTHSPTAIELKILYDELENIIKEAYGDTASRQFLILRCKERGITPEPATNAILQGEFKPENIDVIGQRFNLNELNYIVTEKISDGIYKVQCETAGIIGNQYFGTLIPIEYVRGLETAELTELLIPGEDEEDTEILRQRYFESFNDRAYGGNQKDYITKTNAIPGVGATKVTRVWNSDINPADMIPTAAVTNWYNSIRDSLSSDVKLWLDSVYMAAINKKLTTGGTVLITILDSNYNVPTQTLINTVQAELDPEQNAGEGYGIAPIGHVVTVHGATAISIVIKTNITFDTGYSWSNLQSIINETISDYLAELRQSWADSNNLVVRISQIESRLLNITGIIDIYDTAINGTKSNYTCEKYTVPIFGGASA